MRTFGKIIFVFAVVALIATLVSLLPSDQWFIRAFDMVRVMVIYAAIALLVIAIFVKGGVRAFSLIALALVIGINVWRVWPYWDVAPTDMPLAAADRAPDECFSALSLNVKQKNDGYEQIAEQLRRHDPDLLLLMETNQEWVDELEPILSQYPAVERHPQPNTYGIVFATRLPVTKINVVENTSRNTPTVYATLQPAGFPAVEFIGLHPKPPTPGQDTEKRDENILNAGVQTPDRLPHALVMGDFNDVPWSGTTDRFRTQGGWDDPRIGRGSFATFPAVITPLGWPLDQIMIKGGLKLKSFEVLDDSGSDHLGLMATVCSPPASDR